MEIEKFFLLLTKDRDFIAQFEVASQETSQIGLTERDKNSYYPRYQVAIVDCTTYSIDSDFFVMLQKLANQIVLVCSNEIDHLEQFAPYILAIWQKPIHLLLLQKHLEHTTKTVQFVNKTRDFLGTIEHELRTPINAILGFSKILFDGVDGELNNEQIEDIKAIHKGGQVLLRTIKSVQHSIAIDAGRFKLNFGAISLTELIERTIERLTHVDIHVAKVALPSSPPSIWGDFWYLSDCLFVLTSMAQKYSAYDNTITISAQTTVDEIILSISYLGQTISDSDWQMEMYHARLIWKDGLKVSKYIIEAHGGRLWFESEIGKGTTFYFTLPIAKDETPE